MSYLCHVLQFNLVHGIQQYVSVLVPASLQMLQIFHSIQWREETKPLTSCQSLAER